MKYNFCLFYFLVLVLISLSYSYLGTKPILILSCVYTAYTCTQLARYKLKKRIEKWKKYLVALVFCNVWFSEYIFLRFFLSIKTISCVNFFFFTRVVIGFYCFRFFFLWFKNDNIVIVGFFISLCHLKWIKNVLVCA